MAAASVKPSYEDFEPYCRWQKEGLDTLEVHLELPGFKKEHLKIQLGSHRTMVITGERKLGEKRYSRFRKDINLTREFRTDEIRATLGGGVLRIFMPKTNTSEDQPEKLPPSPPPQNQENPETGSKPNPGSGENAASLTRKLSTFAFGLQEKLLQVPSNKKMGMSVAVAVALLVVVGAFFMYKR